LTGDARRISSDEEPLLEVNMTTNSPAPSFPVALHLENKTCLVVGNGDEAARRARALLEAGARVRLAAPEPDVTLTALLGEARLEHLREPYRAALLDDVWLAVLADRDAALTATLGADCEARRIFFCAVDQPGKNSFAHVGIARAGALTLAIGTDGRAPGLARRLKQELERVFAESNFAATVERIARAREAAPATERATVTNRLASRIRLKGLVVEDE
jgi:uroporphyrin-III C-methyltransferase/precorrin-2 dehydrogenase/sirohydrochlorin ferrochelatase